MRVSIGFSSLRNAISVAGKANIGPQLHTAVDYVKAVLTFCGVCRIAPIVMGGKHSEIVETKQAAVLET
jgi:hypothetical protein